MKSVSVLLHFSVDDTHAEFVSNEDFAERVFNHLCNDEYDEIPELFSVDGYDPRPDGW